MVSIRSQRTLVWVGIALALGLPLVYILLIFTTRSQCWHYEVLQCHRNTACTLEAESGQSAFDRNFTCRARNLTDALLQNPKDTIAPRVP